MKQWCGFRSLLAGASLLVAASAAEVAWEKMPLLTPEAAAAGVSPGGEGGQWPRGPVVVSRSDPDFLLLPIDVGGVYRSLDGGRNWNLSMDGWNARGANGFAIDPLNPDHVLGIGGNSMDWNPTWSRNSPNGLYLSGDRAASWRQVLSFSPGMGGALAFDPASWDAGAKECRTAYFASHDLGLFRSDDGGRNWNTVNRLPIGMANTSHNLTLLALHPRTGRIYLAGRKGLWASDDRGAGFRNLWSDDAVYGLCQPHTEPDGLYLSSVKGIFRSRDSGETWERLAGEGIVRNADEPIRDITVSPADGKRMFCWVQGANWAWKRYISHDGGARFEPVEIEQGTSGHGGGLDAVPGGLAVLPYNVRNGFFAWHPADPDLAYGLGGDWVTRSTDGGRRFVWWNNGYNGIMLGASFNFSTHEPDTVFLAFQDYNSAYTTNGGREWRYQDVSGHGWGGHCYGGHAVDSQVMWYGDAESWGTPRRLRISRDGGGTWNFAKDSNGGDCLWNGADVSFSDPKNRKVLFASQWRSADKGVSWSPMLDCDGVFTATPGGRLVGRKDKALVVSDDAGVSWRKLTEVPGGFSDVACDASRERYYFASDNQLKQWENGKLSTVETPRDQYGNISVATVAVDPKAPEILYIGGAKNIYASHATVCLSTNAGMTWENLTTASGPREVSWIRVHPVTREVWLNGQCYGNWRLSPPDHNGPTPTDTDNASRAPALEVVAPLPPPSHGIDHVIRDFGNSGFDYPYGSWTKEQLRNGRDGDIGYVEIDARENGGAGIVLGDVKLPVTSGTKLALRLRLLPGNTAKQVSVNITGSGQSIAFDLTNLGGDDFTTLTAPLPAGADYGHVTQIQLQGVNWSDGAAPLKLAVSAIGLRRDSGETK